MRRFVDAVVVLAVLCLSWYGAEMLIYDYCQPSIVKAIVAVGIAMSVSGRMEKERIIDERKREFAKGLIKGIQKGIEEREQNGEDAGGSQAR